MRLNQDCELNVSLGFTERLHLKTQAMYFYGEMEMEMERDRQTDTIFGKNVFQKKVCSFYREMEHVSVFLDQIQMLVTTLQRYW